jgi:hypothetical protein
METKPTLNKPVAFVEAPEETTEELVETVASNQALIPIFVSDGVYTYEGAAKFH